MTQIHGHSISGVETCLVVPEFGIVCDIGYCPPEAVKQQVVLVTHGHPDHLAGAIQHAATRSLTNMSPSVFVVPPALTKGLSDMLDLWNSFQDHAFEAGVVGLEPGKRVPLPGKRGLFVEAFATEHGDIASQGYMVIRQVEKLKAEYAGMTGSEIGRLRKSGVEVTCTTEVVDFAYTGDTRPTVFNKVPRLRDAKTLVTECTFVTQDTVEMASQKGHTHLLDLAVRASLLAEVKHIVLTHFSQRHDEAEIREALDTILMPEMRARVVLTPIPE